MKKVLSRFLLILILILAACGGDDGDGDGDGDGDDNKEHPIVSWTSPADGEAGVATYPEITAAFSKEMNPLTIGTDKFFIEGPEGFIAGAVNCEGTTATFTPLQHLSLNTCYTATITAGAEDMDGIATEGDHFWSFTVDQRSWGSPKLIEQDLLHAYDPRLAVDQDGSAIVVWRHSDSVRYNIVSSRYTNGTGWGNPEKIETGHGSAADPHIAVDGNGNAAAVWYQWELSQSRYNLYSNHYTNGVGWGIPQIVKVDTGALDDLCIAVDQYGNATAVWVQVEGTTCNIYASRYTNGAGWGSSELIEADPDPARDPSIDVDSYGNVIAVWRREDQIDHNLDIYSNRYTVGSGWGATERIETLLGDSFSPHVAVDREGNAVAVWNQMGDMYANRYTIGMGWGEAGPIKAEKLVGFSLRMDCDSNGNAVAVWAQSVETGNSIYANCYTAGSGWGSAGPIDAGAGPGTSYNPRITLNPSGSGFAVWYQWEGNEYKIYASRYTQGSGWGNAECIGSRLGGSQEVQLGIDPSGNAFVLWHQFDGTYYSIYANCFR